jgi:oligopeptide transport system substrate-binding protein
MTGCQEDPDEPLVITRVSTVEGQEVIVTRVIRRTVQVEVTPVATKTTAPVTLDISLSDDWSQLDPQRATDEPDVNIIENIFTGLTRHNFQTNSIEPALASNWEVSRDGRNWTFHLRDDVYWLATGPERSPIGGSQEAVPVRPVNAGDVVAAVHRICDPRIPTPDVFIYFIIQGCEQVYGLGATVTEDDLEEVGARAVDDQTVEFTLTEPAGYFLTMTTIWTMRPVPAEQVILFEDQWASPANLLTSGPFYLSPSSVAGTRTVLARNPYWPIPFQGNVDVVNILHLDDAQDAYRLWEDRNLDISPVPIAEQTSILSRYANKADLIPQQTVFYIGYNHNSEVFSHSEMRRAFGWAIDRERMIREVYGGRGIAMRHLAPPGTIGAPLIDEVGAGYNPDRARQQIRDSIFSDCRLMPPIRYMVSSSDLALQQAELVRKMLLEELGCPEDRIVIEQVQFGTLLSSTRPDAGAMRPDMWDLGWSAYYPDEHNWAYSVVHCIGSENRQRRPCSQADDLIANAAGIENPAERFDLYRQVERLLFAEDGLEPLSPLYARARYQLRQSWIVYAPALFGGQQYDTYYVDVTIKELETLR